MLNLLVVDDEYYVGIGIQQTIDWEKYGINIIDIAYDGEEGLEMATRYKPDIIVTDIRMPVMDGLQMIEQIVAEGIKTKFIVLSGYDEFEYAKGALNHGASAYLLKPIENDVLIEKVCDIAAQIKEERNKERLYKNINHQKKHLQKQYLKELLLNTTMHNTIDKKNSLEMFDIKFDFRTYIVAVIKIKNTSEAIMTYEIYIEAILKVMKQEKISIGQEVLSIPMDLGQWALIIKPYDSERNTNIKKLKQLCIQGLSSITTSSIPKILVGVSNIHESIDSVSTAYQEAIALYDLYTMLGAHSEVGEQTVYSGRKEIMLAVDYMKSHIGESITVESVANELYISPFHLMHMFKQELGKTFVECLIELRIELAKELLRNPRYKVYEVASQVGYSDVKYFGKIFKNHTGMTPKDFSKQTI